MSMIAIDKTHPYWKSEQWRRSTPPSLKGIRLPASNTYLEGSGGGDAGQDLWRPAMTEALKGKPRTGFGRRPEGPGAGGRIPPRQPRRAAPGHPAESAFTFLREAIPSALNFCEG